MARVEFPQIRRKIAALLSWRLLVILLVASILLLHLVLFAQNLYSDYQETKRREAEKQAIEAEIAKWEQVVRQRPNYRDAYFELAVLTYRLGRLAETRFYLRHVFDLDPNFEPARKLEENLNK